MQKEAKGTTGEQTPLGRLGYPGLTGGRGIVRLLLCGLLCLSAVKPALAATSAISHFMVSVQVVRDCQYQIRNQPRKPSVVRVVMSGCSGRPLITARGFITSASTRRDRTGGDTTHYLLREINNKAGTGRRYIEIDF